MVQMIGSLYDAIETDYGALATRLYRAFKPKPGREMSLLLNADCFKIFNYKQRNPRLRGVGANCAAYLMPSSSRSPSSVSSPLSAPSPFSS